MGDYKSLPAWKRGMALAHAVYAAAEGAGVSASESGRRLRKAAVSVPSLIGEAYLESGGRDAEESLFLASGRIAELERLLSEDGELAAIPEPERLSIASEIALLKQEIQELGLERAPRN
jgi:four helix bundle protein